MNFPDQDADTSPAELLRLIQARFRDWGLMGQRLTLSYQGREYIVSCDETAFTVYRRVRRSHLPPGRPGWPVCLVTADAVLDETTPPLPAPDEFSSGLSLFEWLDLIAKTLHS
jgi:hypothetical protein